MTLLVFVVVLSSISLAFAERIDPIPPARPSFIIRGNDVGPEFNFVGQVWVQVDADEDQWTVCTGTLIHPRWILTAAHCFEEDTRYRDIAVCMRPEGCESGQYLRASDWEGRPEWEFDDDNQFSWRESEFDQALIQLRYRVRGSVATPVQVYEATPGVSFTGAVVGWGLVDWDPDTEEEDWEHPKKLQKLPVYAVRDVDFEVLVTRGESRAYPGMPLTAPGDSGGPMLMWTLKGWSLVGVNSTINYEEGYGVSGAVTRKMREWIDEILGE